jgi:hypothetical protein
VRGPGSSVGIATELRAGRFGVKSRWGRDFPPIQTGHGAHPASCKMGTGSIPGVKCGRGVLLTTHSLLVLRSWKRRAIPLPKLYLYPPSGPHRACNGITLFTFFMCIFWCSTEICWSFFKISNSHSFKSIPPLNILTLSDWLSVKFHYSLMKSTVKILGTSFLLAHLRKAVPLS